MTRAAIYARYSDKLQKPTSIEDQVRLCRERAIQRGWTVVDVFSDYEVSGFSVLHRPGIQALVEAVQRGKIDVVVSEALDRTFRNLHDSSGFYQTARFAGVRIHTLAEGDVNIIHIGMKGTMNELYLDDLKLKVKRGQRGRVENGKIGGGNCYGYDVVRKLDARGEPIRGERSINEEQARIVVRIFREYAEGRSPKAIAAQLNKEGVPGPTEKRWGPSTIYGNWHRGSGILNNELYVGTIVWNKVSYPKNPSTGKHVTRNNPESDWVRGDAPELRIVDQELWERVKARQLRTRQSRKKFNEYVRPRYLFSYLLKCGCCGGGMAKISASRYGCSQARNKGATVCSNRHTIRQEDLERTVLDILQQHLMKSELVEEFCTAYTTRLNELRREQNAAVAGYRAELQRIDRADRRITKAIVDGFFNDAMKQEGLRLNARREELNALLAVEKPNPVVFHPNMAKRYQREISTLIRSFHEGTNRTEAVEIIRSLIERVVLTPNPKGSGMLISLHGDLAGILNMALGSDKGENQTEIDLKQVKLVVGLDDRGSTRRKQNRLVGGQSTSLPFWQEQMVGPEGLEPPTKRL